MPSRRRWIASALVLVVVVTAVLVISREQRSALPFSEGERAVAADAVVDSVGVNTHLHYESTSYADFEAVQRTLRDLGIRHIRDYPVPANVDKVIELGEDGIRLTAIMGVAAPRRWMPHDLDELHDVTRRMGGAVVALEGANEWDISGDPDWVENLREHQRRLWDRASRSAPSPTVYGPSVTWARNMAVLGDIREWAQGGNIHPYPGGEPPEHRVSADLAAHRRHVIGDEPIIASETGYHDSTAGSSMTGHPGVPDWVAATYLPRLVLHYFALGVERTFLYELVDQHDDDDPEASFGLVDHDFAPKPSFISLRALLAALHDPGPEFEPGRLDFRLDGADRHVRHLLLQKRDATFLLAIWSERPVWDPTRARPLDAGSVQVTVHVDSEASPVRHLSLDPEATGWRELPDQQTTSVDVGPFVQLIEIRPHRRQP